MPSITWAARRWVRGGEGGGWRWVRGAGENTILVT